MPRATAADGTGIAYEVAGSGPPLVFLHGITEDRALWDAVVERLAGEFTCVRMDARGHGGSDPAADYEPVTMAADVGAVVEAATSEPPLLVGHSAGGFQATVYAAAGSGPLRGVVNVDQPLRISDFAAMIRPIEADLRGPGFVEAITAFGDSLGVERLDPGLRARLHDYRRTARPEAVLAMWGAVFGTADAELDALVETMILANVRVPYLALHGADPGRDYVEWLTTRVPTATVEIWDGYGHWLHLVDPDRFVTRVREFVAGL